MKINLTNRIITNFKQSIIEGNIQFKIRVILNIFLQRKNEKELIF